MLLKGACPCDLKLKEATQENVVNRKKRKDHEPEGTFQRQRERYIVLFIESRTIARRNTLRKLGIFSCEFSLFDSGKTETEG